MALSGLQVACLVVVGAAVLALVVIDRPRYRAWAIRWVVEPWAIELTAPAAAQLERRVLREVRALPLLIGGGAAVVFAATVSSSAVAGVPVLLAVFALVLVVNLVAPFHHTAETLARRPRDVTGVPRVARGRPVRVTDHVRAIDLLLCRVSALSAVALLGLTLQLPEPKYVVVPLPPAGRFVLALVLLLALVGVEFGAWWAVRRPRPASTAHALMSEDAVVSYGVRQAYLGVATLAGCTVILGSSWPGQSPALTVSFFVLLACSTVVTPVMQSKGAARHVLVRLWDAPRARPVPLLVPRAPGQPYRGGPG